MIRVLCDDKLIYDSRLPEYTITSGVVTREDNRAGSFVFTIQKSHPNYDHLERMTPTIYVYKDDDPEPVFKGRIINDVDDFYGGRKFTCEGELSFLIDSIQRPYAFADSPEEYFKYFIRNHNSQVGTSRQFTIGSCTVTDPNNYINRSNSFYEDTLENFNSRLIEPLGGHIVFTHDAAGASTINYLAEFPERTTQTIRFGENLLTYARTLDSADIATAIIPLGAEYTDTNDESHRLTIEDVNDGEDYIYNQEAVNQYGWIFKVVEWDDVTIAANLLTKARAYLAEAVKSTVSIELTAADLSAIDKDIADFRLGDLIHVVSKPHGIDDDYVLGKQTIDLLDPAKNTITLGRVYKTFTGNSKSVGKTAAAAIAEAISAQARVDAVSTRAKAAQNVAAEAMPKFGTCSTAAGVAAKANDQTISGFALKVGATVSLLMSKANSVNAPTLNINGTGAKPIVIADGTPLDADNSAVVGWVDDSLITFVYDGTNWRIDDSAALTRIQHILTEDIVGTGGRINMKDGTFNYGNKLVWTGSQLTVDGNVTAKSGNIGGWDIGSTLLQKLTDAPTDGTQYNAFMQAPLASIGDATRAFGVQVREFTNGVAGSWQTRFAVRYDGSLISTKGQIGGWTIGTSSLSCSADVDGTTYTPFLQVINGSSVINAFGVKAGNDYPFRVTYDGKLYTEKLQATGGHIGGWDIGSTSLYGDTWAQDTTGGAIAAYTFRTFLQIPDGSNSVNSFGIIKVESGEYPFAVTYDGKLYAKRIYENGTMLSSKYSPKVTGMAANGEAKTISEASIPLKLTTSGIALEAGHKYLLTYMVQWSTNSNGWRWTELQINGESVGIMAADSRVAVSGKPTICRGQYWIQPSSDARTVWICGQHNVSDGLTATTRYQLIDFGT